MNDDIQKLLPEHAFNDLQIEFWNRFRIAFPELLVKATFDHFCLKLHAYSTECSEHESEITILLGKLSDAPEDEEIIVCFGSGHINTRYCSHDPTRNVMIEDALEVIREIMADELVAYTNEFGSGTCYTCELNQRLSEGDQVYSWSRKRYTWSKQ